MRESHFLPGIVVLFALGLLVTSSYAGIDPKTVVGMWLFDEGEGEIARDSSGKNNDVSLHNGTQWVEGKFGKALEFDGIDDFASANVPDAPQGTALRTVVGWAKSNNISIKGGIVAYGNPVLNCVFGFLHYGGIWYSQLWGAAPAFDVPTNVVVNTSWHHNAVLYDGKNVVHYIDGEKVSSEPRTPTTQGTVLIIGEEVDGNDWFNGLVDEVAIFNVVLAQEDIRAIMNTGLYAAVGIGKVVMAEGTLSTTWGSIKRR